MRFSRRTTPYELSDIKPGHILRIMNGQPIPADLVLLKASGDTYLMTANLDGCVMIPRYGFSRFHLSDFSNAVRRTSSRAHRAVTP